MTRETLLMPTLIAASVLAILSACLLGSTALPADRLLAALFGGAEAGDRLVVWQIRLPRAIAAYIVGAALGISGAALQGLLRNPLAEPGVLGVSASASLMATFALYYGIASITPWAVPIAAIIGALTATALITIAALRTQSVVTLILIGVGLSSFAGAAMSLLMNLAPNPFSLSDMINWMLGSVANRSFDEITLAAPFILAGGATLFATRRGLSALTLGEEAAAGIGLNLRRQQIFTVVGAGLATGGAVALAGAIGFVGIVAPHIIRPFVGHDPARSLVPSALFSGLILVVADIFVRLMPTSAELKLGVVAALIGAPAFVWIAMQRRTGND
ncbi:MULTISPECIES: FecCD family ABC transporter permease [unclassified Hyphomonas]|jgi:iron complex transport system permease protein|uniref:FecCD family ABC transporter permease n=1 Tax=unclassified Hyphomonas TaxID=2630699 RepID=UPI000C4FF941|nr:MULTISPECIES: iron ABC transporter permease [unclassified Hyphomonas]MAN90334.1 ABC transporter permease [Hyphomonadaceae bacterium]MAA83040.1 ABC transporter permease [Hyphomonas sp.]MAL46509.1 ABC transporter permease [Hyphomonas sp.]MAN91114.1 ABC transporter permease [Hyphomonadaceae bacterium]HAO34569.1 ABC transporter permease [Hyphomonas sp.]|tara:strand:+ start:2810 stop:3802 length:993 start_codon:yes stop_codon:yes gene_type:complete